MIAFASLYYDVMVSVFLSEIQEKFNENTLICGLIYYWLKLSEQNVMY